MAYRGKAIHVMAMTLDSGKVMDQKNKQTKKSNTKKKKNPQKCLTTIVPNPSYGLEQRLHISSFD